MFKMLEDLVPGKDSVSGLWMALSLFPHKVTGVISSLGSLSLGH